MFFTKKTEFNNVNKLYNKILHLSRNKFFYTRIGLKDEYQTRIYLIFYHTVFLIRKFKTKNINLSVKKFSQNLFDTLFKRIEENMRELGYGDVNVNKNMKNLVKIFYDILLNSANYSKLDKERKILFFGKYFKIESDIKMAKLIDYFDKYHTFCFDLSLNSVVKGSLNFIINAIVNNGCTKEKNI